ncbi:MFS transporter [Georgenia subflava]|uniref:MFS transporter n=1 Tax=Georgenia subflava TaxID=1622177 RepID=A0A6N7EIT4_9MICO|nr:MFS transporter [Georgenia subflava]
MPDVVRARRRTLRTLIVAQVLGTLGIGAAPSIGVLLAEQVTASETWAGIARSSTTVGAALIAFPLGALAARRGRAHALTLAWSLAAAGAVALVAAAATGSTPLLVLGMLCTGAGTAAGLQSRFAATDLAEPADRGRSLALVVWVGTLGAVVGPNLGVPGESVESWFGLAPLSGAFAISAVLLAATALTLRLGLRPDPLLLAQRHTAADPEQAGRGGRPLPGRAGIASALRQVRSVPAAAFALTALVLAHVAMVSVMTMTPVHLSHHGHGVSVVGLTISLHVVGMFALSPVVGALADRLGRVPVILAGQAVLLVAAAVNFLGAGSTVAVAVGLFVLGLGWSVVTVPAATLLSESVPARSRPLVQGTGDALMNAAAAVGAIVSGPMLALVGFPGLAVVSALCVVPVLGLALRRPGRPGPRGTRRRR